GQCHHVVLEHLPIDRLHAKCHLGLVVDEDELAVLRREDFELGVSHCTLLGQLAASQQYGGTDAGASPAALGPPSSPPSCLAFRPAASPGLMERAGRDSWVAPNCRRWKYALHVYLVPVPSIGRPSWA